MKAFSVLVAAIVGATMAAGCVGSSAPRETNAATPTPTLDPGSSTGSLAGLVFDDEARPVDGADVAETRSAQTTKTGPDGRFRFDRLEPGRATLVVQRLGFETAGLAVEVQAGALSEARITWKPLVIADEPYHESVPRTGRIMFGNAALTTIWYQGVNQSAYNALVCDPCRFTLYMTPGPADILAEAIWNSGGGAGYLNNEVFLNYLTKGTDAEYGSAYWLYYGYHKNRQGTNWPEAEVKKVAKMDQVRLWLRPDLDGASLDHTVTMWTTFGYRAPLAEGFSALPPP